MNKVKYLLRILGWSHALSVLNLSVTIFMQNFAVKPEVGEFKVLYRGEDPECTRYMLAQRGVTAGNAKNTVLEALSKYAIMIFQCQDN